MPAKNARREGERRSTPGSRLLAALFGLVVLAAGALFGTALLSGRESAIGSFIFPAIGGPFRLVDQKGRTVTNRDFRGRWLLVYFGYTHCPDECPTTLNTIASALEKLGPQREKVQPIFITVDPARDTPSVLKAYIKQFAAPFAALTGTPSEITETARRYRVYVRAHRRNGALDHSALLYLMDPRGRFVKGFDADAPAEEIAAALKKLL